MIIYYKLKFILFALIVIFPFQSFSGISDLLLSAFSSGVNYLSSGVNLPRDVDGI